MNGGDGDSRAALIDNAPMVTLFVIAHAPLASAFRDCVAHVFPEEAQSMLALDVAADESPEDTLAKARTMVQQSHSTEVLVFSDLFGGTPCNVASLMVDGVQSRLVTGVNLPMLMRAVTYRCEPINALVARAVAGGTQGVIAVGASAPQNQQRRPSHGQNHHHHQQ